MRTKKNIIYLDNNATTTRCKPAIDAMIKWATEPINPSSNSKLGIESRKMIENGEKYIAKHCSALNYTVLFTSGASESNSMILKSTVEAYIRIKKNKPHVITTLMEHPSILKCCDNISRLGMAEITYISPGISGCINPTMIEKNIKSNTCLISVIGANNEIGCINDLESIGRIAHDNKIPFHSDFVQIFGKFKYNLPKHNIDAISVSFHKLHGPTGCGALIINNDLISGYGLESQIAGTQQSGLRGGTQNVPGIASSIAAMKHTFINRSEKNKKLHAMREYIISSMGKHFTIGDYKKYVMNETANVDDIEIVILGPSHKVRYIPNTILMSIAKNVGSPFCNVKLKKKLDKCGVVVSIGSACNTSSKKASHVLLAIKAPDVIKRGVIRISLCDNNTKKEITQFINALIDGIKTQMNK